MLSLIKLTKCIIYLLNFDNGMSNCSFIDIDIDISLLLYKVVQSCEIYNRFTLFLNQKSYIEYLLDRFRIIKLRVFIEYL